MFSNLSNTKLLNQLRTTKQKLIYGSNHLIRKLTYSNLSSEVINHKEIRVVGLKRSGNHAVINWIRQQHNGEVWHLNNIACGQNPYRFLYIHYPKAHLKREAFGNFTKKDCLIYSYEDLNLELVMDQKFEENHDLYVGKSKIRYDVLVLRDPFNTLASRLKSNMITTKSANQSFIDLWIAYAKEYLGETNLLKFNKICISYNQWFLDVDYRKNLASQFQVEFLDKGIDYVSRRGGGSSFDQRQFDNQASQMDVLNRWKVYANNEVYKQLLNNEELLFYSEKIFGKISGIEELVTTAKL